MGKKLYTSDEGGVKFQSNRKPGEVRIPNYVWDMWMPLIGVTEIGVYAVYCRLEMHGKVGKMTLDDIARACRVGKATLYKINEVLTNCGFITINSPKGHDRAIHKTTEIVVHDPPKEIKPELITKYQAASGYTSLTPWLLTTNGDTTDVLDRTSHSDADTAKTIEDDYKNDVPDRTSELDESDVPSGTSRSSEQNVADVPDRTSNSIATLELQPLVIAEEKTTTVVVVESETEKPTPQFRKVQDEDVARIAKAYEQNIGMITPMIANKIKLALTDYSADWIIESFEVAVAAEKRFWAYSEAILKNWKRDGKGKKPTPNSAPPPSQPIDNTPAPEWIGNKVAPEPEVPTPEALLVKMARGDSRQDVWGMASSQFRVQLDQSSFTMFVQDAKLLNFEDGCFIVQVKSAHARDMCQNRLYRDIRRIVKDCAGEDVEIVFQAAEKLDTPEKRLADLSARMTTAKQLAKQDETGEAA